MVGWVLGRGEAWSEEALVESLLAMELVVGLEEGWVEELVVALAQLALGLVAEWWEVGSVGELAKGLGAWALGLEVGSAQQKSAREWEVGSAVGLGCS